PMVHNAIVFNATTFFRRASPFDAKRIQCYASQDIPFFGRLVSPPICIGGATMRIILSFAFFIALCSPPAAFAYKPAEPTTYKFTTPDKRFVFVMYCEWGDWRERDRALLADYPASGLYKNDGSKQM